ncbi:uncharacterized protein NPIL_600361 [Nephila pilipes]|uniref:Uncharacterized protein n=1 Tax=Nephila pilipes TaxID=299642 RepID=A0A8X6P4S4_NEPPI|nr:uncharacterized protein NPIL_600361 [Nephila pilipes]
MSKKSVNSLQQESSGPSVSNEEESISENIKHFEKEQRRLIANLLKRPILKPFESLEPPKIKKEPPVTQPLWKEDTEPMVSFTEHRKFKKVNETRIITPYLPQESSEKLIIKSEPTTLPELNVTINDPKRFLLEKVGRINVTNLESLVKLVRDYPDIGYIPMTRNHMDLVHDYDPYNYT